MSKEDNEFEGWVELSYDDETIEGKGMRELILVSEEDVIRIDKIDGLILKKSKMKLLKALEYFRKLTMNWLAREDMRVLGWLDKRRMQSMQEAKKRYRQLFKKLFSMRRLKELGFEKLILRDRRDWECSWEPLLKRKDGTLWKIRLKTAGEKKVREIEVNGVKKRIEYVMVTKKKYVVVPKKEEEKN